MAELGTTSNNPSDSGHLTQSAPADHGRYIPCYALLTNPYVGKGELVTLDLTVVEIPSGQIDSMTLGKMISEDVALFNVEQCCVGNSAEGIPIGQIAVMVDSSKSIPSTSGAHYWKIEPMGVMDGTNGLGAAIKAPLVRFVRYLTKAEADETWNKVRTNYTSHGYNVDFGDGRNLLPPQPVEPSQNVFRIQKKHLCCGTSQQSLRCFDRIFFGQPTREIHCISVSIFIHLVRKWPKCNDQMHRLSPGGAKRGSSGSLPKTISLTLPSAIASKTIHRREGFDAAMDRRGGSRRLAMTARAEFAWSCSSHSIAPFAAAAPVEKQACNRSPSRSALPSPAFRPRRRHPAGAAA